MDPVLAQGICALVDIRSCRHHKLFRLETSLSRNRSSNLVGRHRVDFLQDAGRLRQSSSPNTKHIPHPPATNTRPVAALRASPCHSSRPVKMNVEMTLVHPIHRFSQSLHSKKSWRDITSDPLEALKGASTWSNGTGKLPEFLSRSRRNEA